MTSAPMFTFILMLLLALPSFGKVETDKESESKRYELLGKDVFFQPGGGLRVRYEYLDDATGGAFTSEESESAATHRAQLDFRLYKGEYIETNFKLINTGEWGAGAADSNGGQRDGFSSNNGLLVNQAYGDWKVADIFGMRFGRAPLDLGLGFTYGLNDWFNVPYSFDLFDFAFQWQTIGLNLMAIKVQEFSTVAGQTPDSDPEENHIVINLDIKGLSDYIKVFNFSLIQVDRDLGSPDGGVSVSNGLNSQRLVLETELEGKQIFGHFFFAYVAGEERVAPVNQFGGVDRLDVSQTAFDFKLGYRFPQSNNIRFWAGYHMDSGDSNPNDSRSDGYDSFFYDVYGQSGLMDLLRWGNLTFYRVGMDVDITSHLNLGGEFLSFDRSEANGVTQFGVAGGFLNNQIQNGNLVLGNDQALGDEFDIWMDIDFSSGVNMRTTIAAFFPGEGMKGATSTSGVAPNKTILQGLFQIGYFF